MQGWQPTASASSVRKGAKARRKGWRQDLLWCSSPQRHRGQAARHLLQPSGLRLPAHRGGPAAQGHGCSPARESRIGADPRGSHWHRWQGEGALRTPESCCLCGAGCKQQACHGKNMPCKDREAESKIVSFTKHSSLAKQRNLEVSRHPHQLYLSRRL